MSRPSYADVSAATEAATVVEETWTCEGRRLGTDGKLATSWRLPDGSTKLYMKVTGIAGHAYVVRVSRDGDATYVHGNPTWTDERADDAAVLAALDRAEALRDTRAKAERRARRVTGYDAALAPLLELVRAARTYDDREAIISLVTRDLRREGHRG